MRFRGLKRLKDGFKELIRHSATNTLLLAISEGVAEGERMAEEVPKSDEKAGVEEGIGMPQRLLAMVASMHAHVEAKTFLDGLGDSINATGRQSVQILRAFEGF